MGFKVRKLNHSPDWYEEHCRAEDGGSAAFRAMFKNDMAYVEGDFESYPTYLEKIPVYRERWNAVLKGDFLRGKGTDEVRRAEAMAVIEREQAKGFRPEVEYEREPFTEIDRVMNEASLDAKTVSEYLKWRSRRKGDIKRQETQVAMSEEKKANRKALREHFSKRFFDDGGASPK